RGQRIRITFEGNQLDGASKITSTYPGLRTQLLTEDKSAHSLQADITFPADTPAGAYKLGIKTPLGESTPLPFIVDLFPMLAEVEPNDSPKTGQHMTLPVTLVGAIGRAGSVDYYRFEAEAGQAIGVQVLTSAIGSKLDPVLVLIDDAGRTVAEGTKGVLG